MSDASGQLLKVNAEVSLTIYVGGTAMEYAFLVVKSLSVPLILGWNFHRDYVDTISPKSQRIKWDDGTSTVAVGSWTGNTRPAPPRRGNKPKAHIGAIRLRQEVTVGPRCIQAVQVCCSVKEVHLVRERPVQMSRRKVLLHSAILKFSPDIPRSLYLKNIGDAPVHLTKGYVVGTATAYNGPLHVVANEGEPGAVSRIGVDTPDKPDEEAETSRRAEEGIDEGQPPPHLPDETYPKPEVHWEGVLDALRGDVDDLLEEYRALWAGQLGKVYVIPHRIEVTSGARPLPAQPCLASHASRVVIAKEVERQRDLGVIEPSSAEWAFPVVLVPKPDGTMRSCVDYRQLNEVTVRDVYPLPRMDDCIDFLGDAKVSSTLDCNSGYWQIPVADEGCDETTFVCHEGTYRYIRLPFGLSNAPATFQWAIDMILGGLTWNSCLVYLDDITVFSQSAGEHVEHLREVFAALRGAVVSLKVNKCHVFQAKVEYLGHIVGRGQLQVQDKNIRGLRGRLPRGARRTCAASSGCETFIGCSSRTTPKWHGR